MAQAETAPTTKLDIAVSDLVLAEGEPRLLDLRLAEALGFTNVHAIRSLIGRHLEALSRFGAVSLTQEKPGKKGGRPGRAYHLNRRQALYVTAKSDTERSAEIAVQMVEVFDAHLAARSAPPRPESAAIAPLAFLAGPEQLVSSFAVAQALGRRHTGILRELDVLASEQPDLLPHHIRFSTYLHENHRPYRCFHLDRTGFEALMRRLPSSDGRVGALRDATLPTFGPVRPAPALAGVEPRLDRDGFAAMRLGGETVLVDLMQLEPAPGARAVVIGWDDKIALQDMSEARSHRRFLGDRSFTIPDPTNQRNGRRSVWAVGMVVATQPAAAPGADRRAAPRRAKAAPERKAVPAVQARALAEAVVHGHA